MPQVSLKLKEAVNELITFMPNQSLLRMAHLGIHSGAGVHKLRLILDFSVVVPLCPINHQILWILSRIPPTPLQLPSPIKIALIKNVTEDACIDRHTLS